MRRLFLIVILLSAFGAQAQPTTPKPGDPPVLARMTISPPSVDGRVTITGGAGAVFPNAYLTVRNLYTDATTTGQAGGFGGFVVRIQGTQNTPFWINSASIRVAPEALSPSGSLPGGPGTILYNPVPESASASATPEPSAPSQAITPIRIDGDLSDWSTAPDAKVFDQGTRAVYALRNADSLYVAFSGTYVNDAYAKLEIRFTVDTATYTVSLDPRQTHAADLVRVNPATRDLGDWIVAASQISAIELRIPLSFVDKAAHVSLDAVRWIDANGVEISSDTIGAVIPARDEIDGIVRAESTLGNNPFRFSVDGTVASNGALWSIDGQADRLTLQPGATWHVQMDVDYGSSGLSAETEMVGQISLQPIASAAASDGTVHVVGGVSTDNGWSSVLTPSGLPIDNLTSGVFLGEASAQPNEMIRSVRDTRFPLDFTLTIPNDLPSGVYVPIFSGIVRAPNITPFPWNIAASGAPTRLPLVVNVGGVKDVRLLWTLFADDPSDGSRGVLPAEDQGSAALSNHVRFNSPTYILPPFKPGTRDPISYPLEPYLLDELANSYSQTSTPLIPFQFPAGQIQAKVTRPDGTIDDLGSAAIVQNQLSTAAQDERSLFGAQSPVDEYRLATLNPAFSAYTFTQYGEYQITLTGSLQDIWGNHYDGGGTYKILSAEQLDLTPGALPGTPFQVGDALNFGLHVSPGVPADITVTVRVYPVDGSAMIEHTVSGKANAHGYFQPTDAPFTFSTPGEYVIDYEARYTGSNHQLWAASLRGAGVIAGTNSTIVAHGERGVPGVSGDVQPAWFNAAQVEQNAGALSTPNSLFFPYHSGDVAWVDDGQNSTIQPVIRVQDMSVSAGGGAYATALFASLPNDTSLHQAAAQGELPVPLLAASDSYTYVSAVRPNVTVRQFVSGGDNGGLTFSWDEDDPLNRQIGAGSGGNAPGDVIFLFGGAVIRTGNLHDTAIYGALAVVTQNDPPRIYPPDRGAAGGADGGALLTIKGQPVDTFIDLTGVQPGEVLTVGDTIAAAGQVAPLVAAKVTTTFTSPSGKLTQFADTANPVGYLYNPASQFTVDEPGIWTVDVHVEEAGVTSAGQIEPPAPQGSVLGANGERFSIYVLPADAQPLDWNPLLTDTIIPIVSPYNFSFTLPTDWTHIQAYYTLTTPGLIIEDAPLHVNGRSFSYPYNAPLQNRNFPNLENDGRSGPSLSDVRTITFVATGIDASGAPQIRSRTFTLMHDRLITTE